MAPLWLGSRAFSFQKGIVWTVVKVSLYALSEMNGFESCWCRSIKDFLTPCPLTQAKLLPTAVAWQSQRTEMMVAFLHGQTATAALCHGSRDSKFKLKQRRNSPMKKSWEMGIFNLKKRSLQADLIAAFQYLKKTYEKDWEQHFA